MYNVRMNLPRCHKNEGTHHRDISVLLRAQRTRKGISGNVSIHLQSLHQLQITEAPSFVLA